MENNRNVKILVEIQKLSIYQVTLITKQENLNHVQFVSLNRAEMNKLIIFLWFVIYII